jgi:glucose-6-phosphate 1-dehydrogenase
VDFQLTSEQQHLQNKCRELASDFGTRTAAHDREASHPVENYDRLRKEGFLALTVGKVIRVQPDEGIRLSLMTKVPGSGGMRLRPAPLDLSFAEEFHARSPEAYERLLLNVVRGDATLFMRRDEIEAAWSWVEPILDAWANSNERPRFYSAGGWGPSSAIALIERDGRTWSEDAD